MPSPNRNNECNVNCQLAALFRLNLSAIFDLSCQMNQINISSPLQASSITITVTICSHYYDSVCCQVLTLPELRTNWGSCDLVTCLLSLASATVETIPPDMQVMVDILQFTQCKILGKSAYQNKNFKVVSILLWRCFLYKEKYNVYSETNPLQALSVFALRACNRFQNISNMSASDHQIPCL